MTVAVLTFEIRLPWCHSLKEKRMERQRLIHKIQNQFHVSVAEIDAQDVHQTLVLGVASIAASAAQADSILDHILTFAENNSEGELAAVHRELI